MVNISSFGKILKSNGMGIKSIAKTIYKDKESASHLVNLANGKTAVYETTKSAGQLQQTLTSGDKKVTYFTRKVPELGTEVYSLKNAQYVTVPQTQSLSYVKDKGKIIEASNYKKLGLNSKNYKDPATGQIKTKVSSGQEFHQDKFVGSSVLPQDILLNADGVSSPIFQRPMKMAKPSFDVWKM